MCVAFYNDLPCKNLQPVQESALDTKMLKIYKNCLINQCHYTCFAHIIILKLQNKLPDAIFTNLHHQEKGKFCLLVNVKL